METLGLRGVADDIWKHHSLCRQSQDQDVLPCSFTDIYIVISTNGTCISSLRRVAPPTALPMLEMHVPMLCCYAVSDAHIIMSCSVSGSGLE